MVYLAFYPLSDLGTKFLLQNCEAYARNNVLFIIKFDK